MTMLLSVPTSSTDQTLKMHLTFITENSYNEFGVCFVIGVVCECFVKKLLPKNKKKSPKNVPNEKY